MANQTTTIIFTSEDRKIIGKIKKELSKACGPVTNSFVVRQALRIMYESVSGKPGTA